MASAVQVEENLQEEERSDFAVLTLEMWSGSKSTTFAMAPFDGRFANIYKSRKFIWNICVSSHRFWDTNILECHTLKKKANVKEY